MISDEKKWAARVAVFEVFYSENVHQVVGTDLYPKRTDMALAESPETLPSSEIHTMGEPKADSLHLSDNRDFFGPGKERGILSISGFLQAFDHRQSLNELNFNNNSRPRWFTGFTIVQCNDKCDAELFCSA